MSSLVHFWAKSHHLIYLVNTQVPNATCQVSLTGSGEEVLKVYGHGGHISHVTWRV